MSKSYAVYAVSTNLSERRRGASIALVLALGIGGLMGGCADVKPLDYRPIDQIKSGPGLLTGDHGEFVLYGSSGKSVLD